MQAVEAFGRCAWAQCVLCGEATAACGAPVAPLTECFKRHSCGECQALLRRGFAELSDAALAEFGHASACAHGRAAALRCRGCAVEQRRCYHAQQRRTVCAACADALRKELNQRQRKRRQREREQRQRETTLLEYAARRIATDPLLLLHAAQQTRDARLWRVICEQVPSTLTPQYRRQLEDSVRDADADNVFYTLGKVFSRYYSVGEGRETVHCDSSVAD